MKVLLTQTIERIGIVGDVLDVSDGFARNFLVPKGLAIMPTAGNIKRLEQARKDYEEKLKLIRAEKEALLAKLAGFEITIIRNANDEGHLFGSVSRRDISDELIKAGFQITPDDVKLDDVLRRVDTYAVTVGFAADLKTEIKVWVVREKKEGEAAAKPEAPKAEEPAA
jgi:large subunit ribosomal protein L9